MVFTRWSRRSFSATVVDVARPSDPQPALGQAVRQLRKQRKLTQEDLAHAAGITVTALVRIETSKANPTWATVRKIAIGLAVSVGQIADLADRLTDSKESSTSS
jgi:transcriptional regulator with XRE-family HTH domain